VVGNGENDLAADASDLVLSSKARKSGVLNLSAEVEVTGPIAEPAFHTRRSSIPNQVARGLLANARARRDPAGD
jgi:hypothetical protein